MATIGIIMPFVPSAAKTVGRAEVVVMPVSIAACIRRCQTTPSANVTKCDVGGRSRPGAVADRAGDPPPRRASA